MYTLSRRIFLISYFALICSCCYLAKLLYEKFGVLCLWQRSSEHLRQLLMIFLCLKKAVYKSGAKLFLQVIMRRRPVIIFERPFFRTLFFRQISFVIHQGVINISHFRDYPFSLFFFSSEWNSLWFERKKTVFTIKSCAPLFTLSCVFFFIRWCY